MKGVLELINSPQKKGRILFLMFLVGSGFKLDIPGIRMLVLWVESLCHDKTPILGFHQLGKWVYQSKLFIVVAFIWIILLIASYCGEKLSCLQKTGFMRIGSWFIIIWIFYKATELLLTTDIILDSCGDWICFLFCCVWSFMYLAAFLFNGL